MDNDLCHSYSLSENLSRDLQTVVRMLLPAGLAHLALVDAPRLAPLLHFRQIQPWQNPTVAHRC